MIAEVTRRSSRRSASSIAADSRRRWPGTASDRQPRTKAVLGVAAGYQLDRGPLRATAFSGGAEHSARRLVNLGFEVERDGELLGFDEVTIPRRLALRPIEAALRLYVCRPTGERTIAECREHDVGSLLSSLSVRTLKVGGHKLADLIDDAIDP